MRNILKSWKTTTVGIVAIVGLIYKAYLSGGFEVSDFLMLAVGVGFIASKDANKSHSEVLQNTVNPNREYPDERG
tara:strand:- start:1376 stop:1600 length:225 start_codon:yes stop_codon:yes gene_type:complete